MLQAKFHSIHIQRQRSAFQLTRAGPFDTAVGAGSPSPVLAPPALRPSPARCRPVMSMHDGPVPPVSVPCHEKRRWLFVFRISRSDDSSTPQPHTRGHLGATPQRTGTPTRLHSHSFHASSSARPVARRPSQRHPIRSAAHQGAMARPACTRAARRHCHH